MGSQRAQTALCTNETFDKLEFDAGIVKIQVEFVALGFIIAGTVNPFVYGEVINITDSSVCGIADVAEVNDTMDGAGTAILDFSITLEGSRLSEFPL